MTTTPTLAKRLDEFAPSGIRRVMALAAERERQGFPVIHMSVGQPHFDTPEHIKSAVAEALRHPVPGYTPSVGTDTLRAAIAGRVSNRNGIEVQPSSVAVTSGAVMALSIAIQATVDPGDEVLVPDPGWPNYYSAVSLAGGRPVPYALDRGRGFVPDVEAIQRLISPRTRMIIVNSPSNPTGGVFEESIVRELTHLADTRGIYVLSDEIYEDFVFEGKHHSVLSDGLKDRLLMVSGVSKSYAMTGWRIGWLVADEAVIGAAAKLVEPLNSCPVSLSQIAAEAAVRGPQDCVAAMREAYERSLRVVKNILGPLDIMPSDPRGAFFLLLDVSRTELGSTAFAESLLKQRGVAVVPGITFGQGSDNYVRLSTALPEADLAAGCERISSHFLEHAKET